MIPHWKVIQEVANRFGDRQPQFEAAERKLCALREANQPLVQLEDNPTRVQYRVARENTPLVATALERITGTADFQDKYVLDRLSEMSKAVCRILKGGSPIGTGFLVTEDILLTNHHVIESADDAEDMIAEFNYEVDATTKALKRSASFKLDARKFFMTSSLEVSKVTLNSGLDFTLIGVSLTGTFGELLSQFPPIRLDGNLGKIIKGESCVIVQHPNGLPKKVVLKDIRFFSETGTRLVYESDTLPGSSGSPVFGMGTCEIIALHHSGLSRTDDQNRVLTRSGQLATPETPDDEIDWIGNEGIKVSVIVSAVREATLSPDMEKGRRALLKDTDNIAPQLKQALPDQASVRNGVANVVTAAAMSNNSVSSNVPDITSSPKENTMDVPSSSNISTPTAFIISALNKPETVSQIEAVLSVKYPPGVKLSLLTPATAVVGKEELFTFTTNFSGNAHEEAGKLAQIPGIFYAEADLPLYLNADTVNIIRKGGGPAESGFLFDDGYGTPNEDTFLKNYTVTAVSKFVAGRKAEEYRRWNWYATGFDKILLTQQTPASPHEKGIRVVQFDTGYTDHSKVAGAFDTDNDYNFLDNTNNALDLRTISLGKQPGHGTRTGSLLIGHDYSPAAGNGNCGLLAPDNYKLVPFRIAETVVIINRQQQLAAALDAAIAQGFDIITMSMGIPPTLTTARLAKKAYESGVIWCCAAGNSVQAVVAPAVFPGTIAVAASNPLDREWTGSSRGDTVDITAPGEDVLVPIWQAEGDHQEGFAYGDGTSYATPHVAAAAAYWLAKYQDQLRAPEYAGWKRVEAFRQALKDSARKSDQLPTKGFGSGILNAEKLLNTPPKPANKLNNQYNGWNESAFLNSLQGYGEIVKTYWNKLHNAIFGTKRGNQESLTAISAPMSDSARALESATFGKSRGAYESTTTATYPDLLQRFNTVQSIIENAAK
ncbi:Trypsin-like peptidase domain-containing protein [Chitinophaga ginsengisegetis]|uniref:Serine protease n=1 Tax=Chitinophaga ginsengisegetis TaxID=393003 RepID=A0A1T5NNM1_9BACT|nr:S8 family serine peptidase [Chitinophaga ginsengisegetis]SKD02200.1 Trypsin-like peptidase domain-containing protein [Chitinophaga ginsengisegetis]